MPRDFRCPGCGGKEFKAEGGGRVRCAGCGSHLRFRTSWVPFLLTWAVAGAVIGLALNVVLAALDVQWGNTGRMLVFGALTGVVATLVSRRFRTLSRT